MPPIPAFFSALKFYIEAAFMDNWEGLGFQPRVVPTFKSLTGDFAIYRYALRGSIALWTILDFSFSSLTASFLFAIVYCKFATI